jgi:serine/threonine protein kinase
VTVLGSCGTLTAVQESAPAPAPITARTLQPGLVLGRYVVVDRLAAGGMAEVYLARVHGPPRFSKAIALKLLHPFLAADPTFVKMFEKEARIAATLDHPNIVQVLDVDSAGSERFLALEYVHGRDLGRVLSAGGRLPLGAALRVIIDVARALHYAHTRSDADGKPLGLVHRDVSPANVLVSFHGGVKLADFGIAKATDQTAHTATGTFKGKFGYMAPEVYLQEALDARSDVFALGVVLYELTTGRAAFPGDMIAAMNRAIEGRYTPPGQVVPGYSPALAMIVRKALAPRVEDRYASAAAFRAGLEAFAKQQHRIDTSTDAIVRLLGERFGTPAWPDLDTPPPTPLLTMVPSTPSEALTVPLGPVSVGTSPVRRRSRSHRLTVGAIGVLAGALLGWQIARTSAASATEPARAAPAIEATAAASITKPAERPTAHVEPTAPAIDEPVILPPPDEVPAIATTEPVARASAADEAPRPKRRRAHRKAKKPAPEIPAPPSRSADAMLPRSAR